MEIKEAVSILNNNKHETLWRAKVPKIQNANMDKVIALLKRLEKFEKVWEEFKGISCSGTTYQVVSFLEEKYFPKEVANDSKTHRP